MNYCDLNETVSEWQSEEFWIPYRSPIDNRVHRYFPDFFLKYIDKKGNKRTMVVEVKPKKETKMPERESKEKNKGMGSISSNIRSESGKVESSKRVLC